MHLDTIVWRKTNLMHNLFLVYFVNLYTFWAYLGPSSGGTTVRIQQLVLIIQVPIVVYIRLYLLMMGLDTPETCRGWWNILRISCASSWFFFTRWCIVVGERGRVWIWVIELWSVSDVKHEIDVFCSIYLNFILSLHHISYFLSHFPLFLLVYVLVYIISWCYLPPLWSTMGARLRPQVPA
jgi:hypothetical protein